MAPGDIFREGPGLYPGGRYRAERGCCPPREVAIVAEEGTVEGGTAGALDFLIALVPRRGREFVLGLADMDLSGMEGEEELESRCCCCLATNCSGMLPLLLPPCLTSRCSRSSSSESSESSTFPVDRREELADEEEGTEERLDP